MSADHSSGPNVIVFGESGAGKSSVINMLEGDTKAVVSDQATGVTFESKLYKKSIGGSIFNIFDTVGLNEGTAGTMNARDAIESLYKLIRRLEGGVHLLVFVMRAPRIKSTSQQNYDLFYKIFCLQKVPIVIVITGLEDRENMGSWWTENERVFARYEMRFAGQACITATKGRRMRNGTYPYEEEYNESRKTIEELLFAYRDQTAWKMETKSWFAAVAAMLVNFLAPIFKLEPQGMGNLLYVALRQYAGYSEEEARQEAKKIDTTLK